MNKKMQKSMRAIDLNLLPILRELLYTQNVSRAAEKLFMTQSAVSEALGRLRLQFGDEILVRTGRKMVITPFAESLIDPLNDVLSKIENLGDHSQANSIAEVERDLVIATADSVLVALGRNLINYLAEYMPKVHVQFIDLQNFDVRQLKAGDVDLAIMPSNFIDEDGLKKSLLYKEDFVCISRKNHPGISGELTESAIRNLPKVGFRADQNSPIRVLSPPGWDEQLLIPQLTMLPYLIEGSDAIALTQRHVAEQFEKHMAIDIHEMGSFKWAVEVCVYWGTIFENDPAHAWLRSRLKDMLDKNIRFTSAENECDDKTTNC